MGEEKKEENKKEVEEKKEEESPAEIVLKVDMHCEACARKVARALRGFEGVEEVSADSKSSKVVVKGKAADPIKVWERLQKKSGRKVELISPQPTPKPKPPEENKVEENKDKKEQVQKEEPAPPAVVTVILKVRMHCEACALVVKKRIRKIQGVESVETDVTKDEVVVKGVIDPTKLVDYVYKRTRKHASIVQDHEEKKEEEKKEDKEEEKKQDDVEKGKGDDEDKKSEDIKRNEYWPSKHYSDYAYPPPPPPPQIFSDENPNACSIM